MDPFSSNNALALANLSTASPAALQANNASAIASVSGGQSTLGGADATQTGSGNPGLENAFNSAIEQAQQTLEITTKNGAILYSLKQSVR